MTVFCWILAIMGVTGAVLNVAKKRSGFFCWVVANCGWVLVSLIRQQWPEMALWSVYLGIAVRGVYTWGK